MLLGFGKTPGDAYSDWARRERRERPFLDSIKWRKAD
jgi:predicted alpha/beta hydrolase